MDMILKWILEKQAVEIFIGLNYLSIGSSGKLLR
jgi:hypothetical protein